MLPSEYVGRLIETSNKKYKLIEEILILTKSQSDSINEESINNFQSLIDQKQVKIDEVDKIDEEFNVYFQRLKQTLKVSSLDEIKDPNIEGIKELKEVVSQIMGSLKEINNIELSNSIKAKQLLTKLGEDIKIINLQKKANTGYNPTPVGNPTSYFIDKKK